MVTVGDTKASLWVAFLAFAMAAFALTHGRAGVNALLAAACGFSLILVRLRQEREAEDARRGLLEKLSQAQQLQHREAYRDALRVAHAVAEQALSARLQRSALELVAWCELSLERPQAARDALSCLALAGAIDPYCQAAVEDACGHSLWALHIVEREARRHELSREATLFRIDLYLRLRGIEAACALTLQQLGRLRSQDVEQVRKFAESAGHAAGALSLAGAESHLRGD